MKEQAKRRFSILDEPVQLCLGFILVLTFSVVAFPRAKNYQSHTANVNGVKIHYLKAGSGTKPLVLIHGFGDTSRMWVPLFEGLGKDYTIIAPDMRGLGDSSRPAAGYDKKTAAVDIRELVKWEDGSQESRFDDHG